MGGSIVGVHRHQGIAITMLLIHHVERAIALRDTSALLCALMDRMMSFPARLVQWCGYRAKSAKMTIVGKESDGGRRRTWIRLEIDREAPPNGAFERSLGP